MLLVAYLLLFREEYDFPCFLRTPTFHFAKYGLFTGVISANYKHSSPWIQVRHFVLAIGGKRFLHSRIRYYANSDSCFQQTRLLVSGDVPSNPGPVTNASKCSVCSKTVVRNHRAVNCDQCHKWCHINLKIGHSNMNGLVNKLLEVQLLLEVTNFDVLG